ncbi:DUF6477 family protein [Pikeienuella sp. HZG-20]|uniref:DUF6477 family protein n=1 Tax=Paludibacillus litoralis TaxID=3133267 RepID=UPI0030EC6382
MTDTIRRPRLLSRAARAGAALYQRDRDLARILPKMFGKDVGVLPAIMAAEAHCETERRAGAATYSVAHHVSLLSALVAESRPSHRA